MAETSRPAMHEEASVATGWVVAATAGLLGLIVVALAVTGGMFRLSRNRDIHTEQPPPVTVRDAPRLQIDPAADLAELKARDTLRLHQDAVVDIDAAMRSVAGRGDPYAPLTQHETGRR